MKKKSRFWTFVFSFIPGLGHVYLGFAIRGLIFFAAMFFTIFLTVAVSNETHLPGEFIAIFIPVVWFAGMVDSMNLADKINKGQIDISGEVNSLIPVSNSENYLSRQNKNIIAMLLSIVPGAGHMFLGLEKQGLELMTVFFFTFFFTDWLKVSLFMFIIPIIWFYSLFDVLQKISSESKLVDGDIFIIKWLFGKNNWFKDKNKVIGYGLVGIGAILIIEKILLPEISDLLSWQIRNYIETGVISILFILGGIKVLRGSKVNNNETEGDAACSSGE